MNIRHFLSRLVAAVVFTLAAGAFSMSAALAQISIVPSQAQGPEVNRSGTYEQDFNVLSGTGASNSWVDDITLPGWVANVTTYRATASASAGIYSFGSSADVDRAMGALAEDISAPGREFGVRFVNRSGAAIQNFTVSYDGEQWRRGSNSPQRADTLLFAYRISSGTAPGTWTNVPNLYFHAPNITSTSGANLNGNLAENSTRDITDTIIIPGGGLADGDEIHLRWSDLNAAGHEHGSGIDNLRVSFGNVPPSMETARQAASDARSFRLIASNDGGEPVGAIEDIHMGTDPQAAANFFLKKRVFPVIGDSVFPTTKATTIYYCTWGIGMSLFTHHTQKGQMMELNTDGWERNRVDVLRQLGVDPLREVIVAGHGKGKEVFWSLRMNDTHDSADNPVDRAVFEYNAFKMAHLDYVSGGSISADEYFLADYRERSGWSGFNYAVPEVRDRVFQYIQEVCKNYDIDGFELDFFRHPVFFRTTRKGQECTSEEMRVMTQFIARVRAMADEEGGKRSRPILISIRVPDSAEYCRKIGLDVDEWLENDYLDFLVLGGYFQIHNWEDGVAWAREHPGVKVYPSLDDCRLPDAQARTLRESVEGYRGRAAEALNAGMDGIYTFNLWPNRNNPLHQLWDQMGDPAMLETLSKDYFGSFNGTLKAAGGSYPHDLFQTRERLTPLDPYTVTPATPQSAKLMMADTSTTGSAYPVITLRLRIVSDYTLAHINAKLNDTALSLASPSIEENAWVVFNVPPGVVVRGENIVTVSVAPASPPVIWSDVHCRVRYP